MTKLNRGDYLGLDGSAAVQRMLYKLRLSPERVIFSSEVVKINRREREQHRVLVVTNKAIYNVVSAECTKIRRRIPLELVISVSVSQITDEFVVHVPEEYDYRFKSPRKKEIARVIAENHKAVSGRKLAISMINEEVLKAVTVTKDVARMLSREEIMRRCKELAAEDHESDREEDDNECCQLIPGSESVSPDNFELVKVIGRGSFGKVMLVRKKDDCVLYAMKILKKSAIIARNQVEHTKSERKILQTVQHPFLMSLRFAFQTPQKLYFVMDYYKGGELFFHLKNKRRFTEAEARVFVAEVGLALGHLHSKSIIYRDLKPENILMDADGHVCLTDFGLSKEIRTKRDEASTFCGTPEYLAPEIVKGCTHSQAVDWWSLGILLYELTVGIPPFFSQNVHEMYSKIQHGVLRFPPFLSSECKDLIVRLLNRNPEKRLGAGLHDFAEIKAHCFFRGLNWDQLMTKALKPPYRPRIKNSEQDVSNFDSQFTSEPVVDSVVPESTLQHSASAKFGDFTFVGHNSTLETF